MQDQIHRPALPYGDMLTHGYPRGVSIVAAAVAGLVIGIILGVAL